MSSHSSPPSRPAPALPAKQKPVYPHVQDLIARTEGLQAKDRASIRAWFEAAQSHWHQAKTYYEFGKLDSAYVDYLTALTIVVSIIPKCADWPTFKASQGKPYEEYDKLYKTLGARTEQFSNVKEEIRRNNEASGVLSAAAQLEAQNAEQRRLSANGSYTASTKPESSNLKRKPVVRAKPDFLSLRPNSPDHRPPRDPATVPPRPKSGGLVPYGGQPSPTSADLQARFERLSTNNSSSRSSLSSAFPKQIPKQSSISTPPLNRGPLHGPRELPPMLPQLDVVNVMPAMPAPTYSPATSFASPGGMSPPRSFTRPQIPRSRTSITLETNLLPHNQTKQRPTFSNETTVSADMLYAYLGRDLEVSVLLLDVRSREEFDQGHIYTRKVVCIEPIVLRPGMSGDDLDETFVLAPSIEQQYFNKRDQYDLVVYYDQSTTSNEFLSGAATDEHQVALRSLHQAICDYAYGKKLQRPPLLLVGGLDAWIDLVGQQSLKITNPPEKTVRLVPSSRPNSLTSGEAGILERQVNGLGITRGVSPVKEPTPSLAQRRQERDSQRGSMPPPVQRQSYPRKQVPTPVDPINIEEEQRWMERLHKESEPLTISIPPGSSGGDADVKRRRRGTSIVAHTNDAAYVRNVEEFFQRFPATPHSKQPMVTPVSPMPQADGPSSPSIFRRNTVIDHPFYGFTDVRNPEFNPPSSPIRPLPVVPRKSYSGVSERLAPAVPPPIPTLPERPPKIPIVPARTFGIPFSQAASVYIGTTGLKNLGNTCYMNSILQCMSGTMPLSRYFLDGSYRNHINKDNPLGSRGVLAEAFASVVKHLWSGEYKFISPVTIKDVSGRLNEMFRSNDQQDAQEFLQFLLDGLHEDLNPYATRGKIRELTENEERRRESMPVQIASNIEWQRYVHQNFSVVVNWFQGQLSSRLKCLTCGITSTTYSPFMYLSLPIPAVKNARFNLGDCLEEFVKEEVLEGDDAWHCPKCKKPRKATKQLTITRLPYMLIIHLKRFTNDGPWRDKLNTLVDFPLRDLNMTKYVPPLLPREQMPKESPQPTAETIPPFFYDLYGVCNHYGTLNGGHYTSFVRNSYKGAWNLFDDSKAAVIDEAAVVSRNAYVLFWVRSNVM